MARLTFLSEIAVEVDTTLHRLLPAEDVEPARLHGAMRYSLFAGGKRVRPVLTILGGEACGAMRRGLLAPAAALEMIHCFSLIHDDLPALDDDDLRRGRASLHREFDEATAILAGDALLNLALEVLAENPRDSAAQSRLKNVVIATRSVGTFGMIGGQMADLEGCAAFESRPLSHPAQGPSAEVEEAGRAAVLLESIHRRKTGALLEASLVIGGVCAEASRTQLQTLSDLGHSLGLLFQIRDDVLDIEGDPKKIGKTPGKDVEASKLTYPSVFGLEGSLVKLREEAQTSRDRIRTLAPSVARDQLLELVEFLVERDH